MVGFSFSFSLDVLCVCMFINGSMEGFGLVLGWFWSCFWFGGCCVTGEIDLKCKDGEIEF